MKIDQIKKEIEELLDKLSSAIALARTLGLSGEGLELLEDQEWYLQRLLQHIDALKRKGASLSQLESELRETRTTLQGLKETLLLYDDPDQELVSKVDSARILVSKNLKKVRTGRTLKAAIRPALVVAGVLAFHRFRKKRP